MIPDIGGFHPQVVHFVIALLIVGVVLRLISLSGKVAFSGTAALTLLLVGTAASVVAVKSGDDAHGPAERVPGARSAVVEHEEWGERTRNVFLGVVALELLALAFTDRRRKRAALIASGVVGLAGTFVLYETAEHGGELVYDYAGGVGVRSGEAESLDRLLLAGLYHNAMDDRSRGRSEDAARLFEEMARRFPDDQEVQLVAVESLVLDRGDADGALAALAGIAIPEADARLRVRLGMLTADALLAAGRGDSARTVLEALQQDFPSNQRIERKLAELPEATTNQE